MMLSMPIQAGRFSGVKPNASHLRFGHQQIEEYDAEFSSYQLQRFKDRFQKLVLNSDCINEFDVETFIPDLQAFVRQEAYQKRLGDILVKKFPELAKSIRQNYAKYVSALEMAKAKSSNSAQNAAQLFREYQSRNSHFAKLETNLSNMGPGTNALFVGSGPFPDTAMVYAASAGKVGCLDRDAEAVRISQEFIKKLPEEIAGKLTVIEGDAQAMDYKGYTHISLAAMIEGKKEVLQRILETADPGTMVLCRSTDGLRALLYEPVDPKDLEGFEMLGRVYGKDSNIVHTILLKVPEKTR